MVKNSISDDEKVEAPASVRIPVGLKRRIEEAARANRKSFSAEVVYRLAQSFGIDPNPYAPTHMLPSETATEALRLARGAVGALREVCDDRFVDALDEPTRRLFIRLGERLSSLETSLTQG